MRLGSPIALQGLRAEEDGTSTKEHQGAGFQRGDRILNRKKHERKGAESSVGDREARVLSERRKTKAFPLGPGSDGKG